MVKAKTKRTWFVLGGGGIGVLVLYSLTASVVGQQGATTFAQITPTPLPTNTTIATLESTGTIESATASAPALGSIKTTESGAVMIYIPAGSFLMGSTDADDQAQDDEKPQHSVYLDSFWIDKFEVTNALYKKCVDDGTCSKPPDWSLAVDDHPVHNVSWKDANVYLKWLNQKTGKAYRLPTEAEWEKAACWDPVKQEKRIYPWGNDFDDNLLKPQGGDKNDTLRVGSFAGGASPYGAMDMVGNVWEWVADLYDWGYYDKSPKENPKGPDDGIGRVLRGGWWVGMTKTYARCSTRIVDYPLSRNHFIGFRVAESDPP